MVKFDNDILVFDHLGKLQLDIIGDQENGQIWIIGDALIEETSRFSRI
jgi:hypothetical protein